MSRNWEGMLLLPERPNRPRVMIDSLRIISSWKRGGVSTTQSLAGATSLSLRNLNSTSIPIITTRPSQGGPATFRRYQTQLRVFTSKPMTPSKALMRARRCRRQWKTRFSLQTTLHSFKSRSRHNPLWAWGTREGGFWLILTFRPQANPMMRSRSTLGER